MAKDYLESKNKALASIKDEFTWRDIKDELVVLNSETGEYHVFNDIGRLVWIACTKGENFKTVIEQITNEYDIEEELATKDVIGFLAELNAKKMIHHC